MDATPAAEPALRERLAGYLVAFGIGLAVGAAVGVIVWLATAARLSDAVGYTYCALGAVLLLVGGVRGSGYSRPSPGGRAALGGGLGAAWEAAGRRGEAIDPVRLDPRERRRRRLMAPANPAAFWQVVAGCAYLAIGVLLTVLLATPAG